MPNRGFILNGRSTGIVRAEMAAQDPGEIARVRRHPAKQCYTIRTRAARGSLRAITMTHNDDQGHIMQREPQPLAPPFDAIFASLDEAEWGFDFLRHTFELLGAAANNYRPTAITLPKSHKLRLLRFNFGPWLLVDFCGPRAKYGKRINLALLKDDRAVDPRKHWLSFNYPHDHRGVSIYKFGWDEIQHMDARLQAHYEESMYYTGSLMSKWRGSPYRLAHQPQIFDAVFNPAVRADLLTNGLDPFYVHKLGLA